LRSLQLEGLAELEPVAAAVTRNGLDFYPPLHPGQANGTRMRVVVREGMQAMCCGGILLWLGCANFT
jgi:hypothetical protein